MTTPKDDFGDLYHPLLSGGIRVVESAPPPTVSVDRDQYDLMKDTLKRQDTLLKRVNFGVQVVGTVMAVRGDRTYVCGPNGALMVKSCPGARSGKQVYIDSNSNAILGVLPDGELTPVGVVAQVERFGSAWIVRLESGERAVSVPEDIEDSLSSGDRVVIHIDSYTVLANLGKSEARHAVTYEPLHWDEIGGCAEAKKALRQAVEYPVTHANLYRGYHKRASRGVLLYGPAGTGKTMLGRATATAVAGSGPDAFLYVKGPEVRSKWVGETEANIRRLFDRARAHKASTGRPAVIFIDEADALLGARDMGGLASNDSVTVVPMFLAEMDGLQESSAFVMLATNHPGGLDPAVVRAGRIDRLVHVTRPDRDGAAEIFRLSLRGVPCDTEALTFETLQTIYSDEVIVKTAELGMGQQLQLHLKDVLGGAVIAGIVDKAVEKAIERDRESGATVATGLTAGDMRHGVFLAARELADTNLIQDFNAKLQTLRTEGN